MSRARELSERTGDHFNHNELPLFFVGDLASPLVLVHLNPKHANTTPPRRRSSPCDDGERRWTPVLVDVPLPDRLLRLVVAVEPPQEELGAVD